MRSHSMETMVGGQRKLHGGGIPGSLSGGIVHNSMEVTKTTFSVSVAEPGLSWGREGSPANLFRGQRGDRQSEKLGPEDSPSSAF